MASKHAQKGLRKESNKYNNDELRIVLVGKTGAGKSSTGNNILGIEHFKSSVTCLKASGYAVGEVDGQRVKVIDTPGSAGLLDTKIIEEETIRNASPGPHVFLVVIKIGRFTDEEKQTVKKIQEMFGEEADKYSMILFTHGDVLDGKPMEEFLKEREDLQELVARCNGQYHVFNNDLKDRSQVTKLLDKIRNITEKNGRSHYTNEMFQNAGKTRGESNVRILGERKEKMCKQEEEFQMRLDKKYEEQLKHIKEDRERSERQIEREMEEERGRMKEEEEMQIEAHEREMEELRRGMREAEERLREASKREMEELRRRMREMEERLREARIRGIEEERRRMREEEERLKADIKREMENERKRKREEKERIAREEAEKETSTCTIA